MCVLCVHTFGVQVCASVVWREHTLHTHTHAGLRYTSMIERDHGMVLAGTL